MVKDAEKILFFNLFNEEKHFNYMIASHLAYTLLPRSCRKSHNDLCARKCCFAMDLNFDGLVEMFCTYLVQFPWDHPVSSCAQRQIDVVMAPKPSPVSSSAALTASHSQQWKPVVKIYLIRFIFSYT